MEIGVTIVIRQICNLVDPMILNIDRCGEPVVKDQSMTTNGTHK